MFNKFRQQVTWISYSHSSSLASLDSMVTGPYRQIESFDLQCCEWFSCFYIDKRVLIPVMIFCNSLGWYYCDCLAFVSLSTWERDYKERIEVTSYHCHNVFMQCWLISWSRFFIAVLQLAHVCSIKIDFLFKRADQDISRTNVLALGKFLQVLTIQR